MRKTLIATTAVIFIIAVFSLFAAKRIKNKDHPTLNPTIRVYNLTAEPYLDSIINIGADMLEIKDINIVIVELTEKEQIEDEVLLGYIIAKDTYYLIKLKPGLYRDFYCEIIAHEIIHGKQMYIGKLKQVIGGFMYDNYFYPNWYPYEDRSGKKLLIDLKLL